MIVIYLKDNYGNYVLESWKPARANYTKNLVEIWNGENPISSTMRHNKSKRYIKFVCCNDCYANIISKHNRNPTKHTPCSKCSKKIDCLSKNIK